MNVAVDRLPVDGEKILARFETNGAPRRMDG